MALAAETGNQAGAPGIFAVLAEAQQAAGQLAEAQRTVAAALAVAAQTGQPFFDADLHRLDGDLLLATGGPADESATRYHRALAIAREQGARSFELRAATSLARLWRDQGKRADARDLLAVRIQAALRKARTTAAGSREITSSSTRAAPSGVRFPCSQLRTA
jgi:predicted ATPase